MEKYTHKSNLTTVLKIVMVFVFLIGTPCKVEAQFFKKLAEKAEKKIEQEAEKRAERRMNKAIDDSFDEVEDTIDGKNKEGKKDSSKKSENEKTSANTNSAQNEVDETTAAANPNVSWSKFDFVPGDTVIFEDGPSTNEENGEFPSRWDLVDGQVEVANIDGENVMMFIDGNPAIVPYLKNSKEDYLPEVFTIEFDFYKPVRGNRISVYLYDKKNQKPNHSNMYMDISSGGVTEKLTAITGAVPKMDYKNIHDARWIHVSIAFTKGKLKVYMDDTRVINVPHYEGNPTGLTLQAYWADLGDDKAFYFKNISIAKGGVKYYNRVLSDGKIIVNGIKFDTNKATLKPESMGPINTIYELMQKQPDLNFSVEGHTDSDGDDTNNQTLSEARGKSVMNKLIEMGISKNRLKSTGFGESKPLDNNSTPEGKANNRRVEFVKFTGSASTSIKGELMKLTGSSTSSGNSNSAYDKLDKASAESKLYELFEKEHYTTIPLLNNAGVQNGPGTVIVYATSDGNIGKMEILNIEKNTNYKLTIKYVTYNNDGSIRAQSNHFEIKESYNCDLDKENAKNMIHSEKDFQFSKENSSEALITPGELSSLRILR